jgi:hypothetical protein
VRGPSVVLEVDVENLSKDVLIGIGDLGGGIEKFIFFQ